MTAHTRTPTVAIPGECPFCKSDNLDYGHHEIYDESHEYDIECNDCHKSFIRVDNQEFSHYELPGNDEEPILIYVDPRNTIKPIERKLTDIHENWDSGKWADMCSKYDLGWDSLYRSLKLIGDLFTEDSALREAGEAGE